MQILKINFADLLTKIRQTLTTPKLITHEEPSKSLNELLVSMVVTIVEKVKGVLQDLVVWYFFFELSRTIWLYWTFQVFIQPDISFSQKSQFRDSFCVDNVREGLIVCFMHHFTATCRSVCASAVSDTKIPPTLLLLLSKLCLDFRNGSVHFLVSY